ncbi:ABC transporter permease [Georgenia sp. AZ-5]|uniref:ABC transporter permease n=1 Tax=Georgenia sp. AZ-5 TaxID=3367526 RepID=UPI0037541996
MSTFDTLTTPGTGHGLLDVFKQRYLLKLVVRKELRVRYHGSVLGMLWSYVKPATQFLVFYFAMGVFLGLNRNLDYFAVYLFSGIVVTNFFGEAFGNATRTLVWNAPLIKKIYLPREMFPVASIWVAVVHFLPQLVVLLAGALLAGWRPTLLGVGAFFVGLLIVSILALGVGMLFGAVNVYLRDAENFVDLLLLVTQWASPVLYPFTAVQQALAGHQWLLVLYQLNPITAAVELFHYTFWLPVAGDTAQMPPHLPESAAVALVTAVVTLIVGQLAFRKLEGRFAQEL